MITPLLTTKLYIPSLRQDIVRRKQLVEKLNAGIKCKLTLLSAPAGFGKTTLVSDWINQGIRPAAWISLDENDNDLRCFLDYFIASLKSIGIDIDEQLLENIPGQTNLKIESILIPLINQITNTSTDFILVLDDYHLIQNQKIHTTLIYFLEHLPPTMHLVISSRADPPIPLARLRAQGQITEIRAAHLGFSLVDAEKFLNQILALNLTQDSIRTLIERTDGWIAALQMVSISLQGKSDVDEYIQGITGNYDYIADFLTEEVVQRQPADVQDFLLKTSFLDKLSGSLCDAVTGRKDSQTILKQLRDANLFLLSLDDHSDWFQYHQLFADLLCQRLTQLHAKLLPTLNLKASEWFETHNIPTEAIKYAFRGQHIERAAYLIEQAATETLIRSEIATFIRWVEKLPDKVIYKRDALCIDYAWSLLVSSGDTEKAEKYLRQVETDSNLLSGRRNAVKSMISFYRRNILDSVRLARLAFDQIPEDDYFYRQIATWNLSATLFISGDTADGIKMLEESIRINLASKNLLVAIVALCRLGSYYTQIGELDRAEDYFEQALWVKPIQQAHPLPAACEAMMGLGKLAWERYELESARQYINDGLQLSKSWRESVDIDGFVVLAHLYQSWGDVECATQNIRLAQDLAKQTTVTDADDRFVASHAAHLLLRQGNLNSVKRWVNEKELESICSAMEFAERQQSAAELILIYELIVYARYLLAVSREQEALALLEKLLPPLKSMGYQVKVLEIQMLQALGLQFHGKIDAAVIALGKVLDAAEDVGIKRIFIDQGPQMAHLIKTALAQGLESQFARSLLDIFEDRPVRSIQAQKIPIMIDSLSERELEILRFLISDIPVPEIAAELHIAVSTLRTHIKNIYSKLNVHSRFEAVSKGRDLGLI